MNHILDLIRQHGELFYLVTFIWTALEGETFVIFAGLAAQRELLDIRMLFIAAGLGSMLGDQVCFFVGRYFGKRVLKRFPKIEPKMQNVFSALEKYSTSFILTYRFMYGLRNISALAIGMSNLPWRRFFALNFVASFLWAFIFCGAGYAFGDVMERMGIGDEASVNFEVRGVMIAVLSLFILFVLARYWRKSRLAKEAKPLQPDLKDATD